MNNTEVSKEPVYNAECIASATQKGGVLKTTINVNLAGDLSQRPNKKQPWRKNKVLLIDKDSQGNVLLTFGMNPDKVENTIYDVLLNDLPAEEAVIEISDNLHIIPANDDMAFFELDVLTGMANKEVLAGMENILPMIKNLLLILNSLKSMVQDGELLSKVESLENEARGHLRQLQMKIAASGISVEDIYVLLKKAIAPLKTRYDFIIIDTPPQLGIVAGNVYNAVDDILIPFHPEKYSFRSLIKTINTINSWKQTNPDLNVKAIIPVKLKEQTITHSVFLDSSSQIISSNNDSLDITKTVIPESIKPAEALAKYNMPYTMIDTDTVRTKKEREPLIMLKEVFKNLVDELGY